MRRVLLPLAVLILILGAGLSLKNKLAADRQGEWVHPTRGDLVTGVDVVGTLASVESDAFGPPQLPDVWDFKISMMAPEGADVKKNQPVLGFDTTELQRRLDEKRAESDQALKEIEKRRADLALRTKDEKLKLAESEAKLRKTQLKLEAPPDIMRTNERRQVELDYSLAKRELDAGKARIHALEAAANAEIQLLETKQREAARIVTQTQDAIRRMTIMAPRDGTIVYVTNWRGDKKKIGDTCWKRERAIEIPNLNRMMAKGEVDEVDAGRVATGQRVSFRLDAHPDEVFRGTISQAANTVQLKMGSNDPLKIMRVDIALDRTDPAKMRPGMRFKGTVELSRMRDVLLVPKNAITIVDENPIVYRRGLFAVTPVAVKLGRQGDEFVQIVDGLSASDRILVSKGEPNEAQR